MVHPLPVTSRSCENRRPRRIDGAITWLVAAALVIAGCDAEPASGPTSDSGDFDDTSEPTAQIVDDESAPAPAAQPDGMPPDFAQLVAGIRPAVVNIYTRTDPPEQAQSAPFSAPSMVPDDRIQESLGSGFIFDDDDDLVLTNHHVVDGASEIAVRLLDDRVFSAQVRGSDAPTDIAVLELQDVDTSLPTAPLGDADDLQVGNWVLAIGNPLGLSSTVTAGIVSASGRQVMPPGGQLRFQDFIQTDASINPGSSGGPLVATNGDVLGIATAVSSDGQGLGFAIPISMVHEVLDDLIEYGRVERSWLGVYIGDVPDAYRDEFDLPDSGGAMITRLVDDAPADDAGIEPADVLVKIDDQPIDDANHLAWMASTLGVGNTVDAVVYRGDEELTIPLTLSALPE